MFPILIAFSFFLFTKRWDLHVCFRLLVRKSFTQDGPRSSDSMTPPILKDVKVKVTSATKQ